MSFRYNNFAEEYDRRLSSEGYPGNLLDIVLSELGEAKTVIDIGAGSGFFTMPLLEMGCRVTAIEPSVEMVNIMIRKLGSRFNSMLRIDNARWEEWNGDSADSIISVHSVYRMKDMAGVIRKMKEKAGRCLLVVNIESKTMSEYIRSEFKMIRGSHGYNENVLRALGELSIEYKTLEIEHSRKSVFSDIDEEAGYYCRHLGLGNDCVSKVCDIIKSKAVVDGDIYSSMNFYLDRMFIFPKINPGSAA
jgi:2-polyprenyl-3-methyl-5-hydroxy-6-metoxy-1,4-benzoquinol methylase